MLKGDTLVPFGLRAKIVLIGLNFSPEVVGIGKYTGELAEYFASIGHQVRIITAPPYYPEWEVRKGYKWWSYSIEQSGSIKIFRCPVWVPRRVHPLTRIIHLISFALSSFPLILAQIFWRPQVFLCVIPSSLSIPATLLSAKISGSRSWLHVQDFEIDAASGLNFFSPKAKFIYWLKAIERFFYSKFDSVSTISSTMKKVAISKTGSRNKVFVLKNWVDTNQIYPIHKENTLLSELELPKERFIVLYHGSLGQKQGLELLIDAAVLLEEDLKILFLICGQGPMRDRLETMAVKSPNVKFIDLQPPEKLNQLVNLADIHVLPQRRGVSEAVMPSKLTTMLASGKPILVCTDLNTALWEEIKDVAVIVPPEDPVALSEAILDLKGNPEERVRLGKLARDLACKTIDKKKVLLEFQNHLTAMVNST